MIDVCAHGDIADGDHKVVDLGGGEEIAVFFIAGRYYAVEDLCTHDGASISHGDIHAEEGKSPCIECPRHGARFALDTGAVVTPPAWQSLETFPVEVVGGRVMVDA